MFNYLFVAQKIDELSLTLDEVAEKIGVSNAMVSYIKNGLKVPSLLVAYRISRLIGCTLDELVKGEENA